MVNTLNNKIGLNKMDKLYLFILISIVIISLYSISSEAFYGSSDNFIYTTEYDLIMQSLSEEDYLSVYDCVYDLYGSDNYIYCLSYYRDKIYTIDEVFSNGYFKYTFNFITEDYQSNIYATQYHLFTLTTNNELYQYRNKDVLDVGYAELPNSYISLVSSKNYLFAVDNYYASTISTIRKITENISSTTYNINVSIIDSYNITSCTSLYDEEIFYNYNIDTLIVFKFCNDSTSEIHFLDSDLNYIKNKTGLDDTLNNIVFYEVNNSNYFLVYENKVEKYNNNILGNTLYGNIFNVGEKSHYYNYTENKLYTCDINLSCPSYCSPLSSLTSESHYGVLPIFTDDNIIFSSKIIDTSSCLLSEITSPIFIPDIFIKSSNPNYFIGYEKGYEIKSFYISTAVTTTTTTTSSSTTTSSTTTSTSSTSSSSSSSTSSTTSLISNEDIDKINDSYMQSYSIGNNTANAISSGVGDFLNSSGATYNEISFGKSQQKEESINIILMLLDFFILFLVLVLLFSVMTVIRQKRNRYY